MDMIVGIFSNLGVDGSIVHQFIIIVVMFFLTKFLFLNHLQNLLDNREDKTVNLEGSAEKQFDEVEKIKKDYKQRIQTATKEIKTSTDSSKAEIAKREEAKYRTEEKEVNTYIEQERKKVEAEISEKKVSVLSEAKNLASHLVYKIAKVL